MKAPVPALTAEQRQEALAKARQSRQERARMLEQLKSGELTLHQVFDRAVRDPDGPASRTRITAVLQALPGYGEVRAARLLEECGVNERRKVRGVGPAQRIKLVHAVNGETSENG